MISKDEKTIIELYKNGKSIKDISNKLKICGKRISRVLKENDIPIRYGIKGKVSSRRTPKDVEDKVIYDYLNTCLTMQSISEKFDIHTGTIKDILKRYNLLGYRKKLMDNRLNPIKDKIIKMYKNGDSITKIKKECDLRNNHLIIYNTLRKRGIDIDRRSNINLSKEEREEIIILYYTKNISMDGIAEKLKRSKSQIYVTLKKYDLKAIKLIMFRSKEGRTLEEQHNQDKKLEYLFNNIRSFSSTLTQNDELEIINDYYVMKKFEVMENWGISQYKLYKILDKHNAPRKGQSTNV